MKKVKKIIIIFMCSVIIILNITSSYEISVKASVPALITAEQLAKLGLVITTGIIILQASSILTDGEIKEISVETCKQMITEQEQFQDVMNELDPNSLQNILENAIDANDVKNMRRDIDGQVGWRTDENGQAIDIWQEREDYYANSDTQGLTFQDEMKQKYGIDIDENDLTDELKKRDEIEERKKVEQRVNEWNKQLKEKGYIIRQDGTRIYGKYMDENGHIWDISDENTGGSGGSEEEPPEEVKSLRLSFKKFGIFAVVGTALDKISKAIEEEKEAEKKTYGDIRLYAQENQKSAVITLNSHQTIYGTRMSIKDSATHNGYENGRMCVYDSYDKNNIYVVYNYMADVDKNDSNLYDLDISISCKRNVFKPDGTLYQTSSLNSMGCDRSEFESINTNIPVFNTRKDALLYMNGEKSITDAINSFENDNSKFKPILKTDNVTQLQEQPAIQSTAGKPYKYKDPYGDEHEFIPGEDDQAVRDNAVANLPGIITRLAEDIKNSVSEKGGSIENTEDIAKAVTERIKKDMEIDKIINPTIEPTPSPSPTPYIDPTGTEEPDPSEEPKPTPTESPDPDDLEDYITITDNPPEDDHVKIEQGDNLFNIIVKVFFPTITIPNYFKILKEILKAIKNVFVIDTDAIKLKLNNLKENDIPEPEMFKILAKFKNIPIIYPQLTIDTPEIIKPYYHEDKIILVDFMDYKKYCIWARELCQFAICFAFGWSFIRKFQVKIHIG